ncbi:MAG: hypothetical protein V3T51_02505, partial [Gammaproteobacteria bacterium]
PRNLRTQSPFGRQRPRVPYTWCTRKDPFEAVWPELKQRVEEQPEMTAKVLFKALQQRCARFSSKTRWASTISSNLNVRPILTRVFPTSNSSIND